jgi:hypothetical protein
MPRLQRVRQTPRCFGNDLETAGDGIDRAYIVAEGRAIETGDESDRKVDVVQDVA